MAEHAKTSGTNIMAVGQHLADNPGHSANTANPDVLASSRYSHIDRECVKPYRE